MEVNTKVERNDMRILYAGTFTGFWVSDHHRANSFKKYFDRVVQFDYRTVGKGDNLKMCSILHQSIGSLNPHVLFVNKGEQIIPNTLHRIKLNFPNTFIVAFNGDQRGKASNMTAALGRVADGILINNQHEPQWKEYKDMGVRAIYEYHTASDPSVFKPIRGIDKKFDIVFVGGNYGDKFPLSKFRLNCIRELAKDFKVAISGTTNWRNVPGIHFLGRNYDVKFSEIAAQARCILGVNAFDNVNHYTSNRTWNSMACGRPYVCHYYQGAEHFFDDKKNILFFRNIDDLKQIVSWIKANEKQADQIGAAGRKLIQTQHTYDHRTEQLLRIYEQWKK